jgi:hypothetical protein
MIAAAPGWRIVLVDRENGGSVALPIVAWEKTAALIADDESSLHEYLAAWYDPAEDGVPPLRVKEDDLVCGYLAPGQEWQPYWDEVGNDLLRIHREIEEREDARLEKEVDAFAHFSADELHVLLMCMRSPRRTRLYPRALAALREKDPERAERVRTRLERRR